MKTATGSCLCKAVTVTFPLASDNFDVCHCGMCRKWGGGPAFSVDVGGQAKFSGEEFISVYQSSDWAERGFCKRCGTHLFYRLKPTGFHNFPMGLIDGHEGYNFRMQIFIDRKPGGYNFKEKTETMTEAEVVAKYIPK